MIFGNTTMINRTGIGTLFSAMIDTASLDTGTLNTKTIEYYSPVEERQLMPLMV